MSKGLGFSLGSGVQAFAVEGCSFGTGNRMSGAGIHDSLLLQHEVNEFVTLWCIL